MRGQRRRSRVAAARWSAVALAGLLVGGCASGVAGTPVGVEIPETGTRAAVTKSLIDLAESGALRYAGTLSTASDDAMTFDLTAVVTGEMHGTITLEGKPATVVLVNRTLYVKAAADFWSALSGVANGQGKGAAVADRWVKVPAGLIGVEFADVFTPDVLGPNLGKGMDGVPESPLASGEKTTVGEVPAVKVRTGSGVVYLAEKAPHGVLKIELEKAGKSGSTSAEDLVATVADTSSGIASAYQAISGHAAQLGSAIDVLTTIDEGGHRWGDCGASSCAIIVDFTNTSKAAVRVSVRANWVGDGAALGSCDAVAGPVAPGQASSATCVISSPQWVDFHRRANSVPGNHPYSAEWSTLVLADAPDLTQLTARTTAKPAPAGEAKTEGSHYLYKITYSDSAKKPSVWKFGVVPGKFWADHARQQLGACLTGTRSVCSVELVTATGDAVSAHGLLVTLVGEQRATGACPTGQWVSCATSG